MVRSAEGILVLKFNMFQGFLPFAATAEAANWRHCPMVAGG
jgi:hypothetical protein